MTDIKLPPELIEAVKKNELIIFVGAGLSYNLVNINNQKIKGWANLVRQILDHLKSKGFDVDYLSPLVERYEPIKVLELIELELDKSYPKSTIVEFMKDFFDLHKTANDYNLHKSIFELSKKIITTNYDTAFESAIDELRKYTAYKGKNYELTKHKDSDAPLLFKLHGCYENAGTMILFPSSYKDLYNNSEKDAEHSLLVLRNIIVNKMILFVGAGMGDFQINNIFSEIKKLQGDYNQKHFIIIRKQLENKLNFLTPIHINNFDEIKTIIDKLIQIKQEVINQKSHETLVLEEQLKETEVKLKEMQERIVENESEMERKDRLLERESLKYFKEGVSFHIGNELEKAIEYYQLSVELNPKNNKTYYNWGNAIYELARIKNDEKLYEESLIKYELAVKLEPKNSDAYNSWGGVIFELAKIRNDEKLYEESLIKYKLAIELNPADSKIHYNYANAICKLAQLKNNIELFKEGLKQYQLAVELDSRDSKVFNNWGNAILKLAKHGKDEDLYRESIEKYKSAIELNPHNSSYHFNLGTAIYEIAQLKNSKELYQDSLEKYKLAAALNPNDSSIYNNWGNSISNLARLVNDPNLFEGALEKYQKAAELNGRKYNLACIYALKKDKGRALLYLEDSLKNKENTIEFIKTDEDWKEYLADPDFLILLEKYNK